MTFLIETPFSRENREPCREDIENPGRDIKAGDAVSAELFAAARRVC